MFKAPLTKTCVAPFKALRRKAAKSIESTENPWVPGPMLNPYFKAILNPHLSLFKARLNPQFKPLF